MKLGRRTAEGGCPHIKRSMARCARWTGECARPHTSFCPHMLRANPRGRENTELGRRGRNVDLVRGNQFRIGYFCRNLDSLPATLFLGLGEERQPILMVQVATHILEEGFEAYRGAGEADVI